MAIILSRKGRAVVRLERTVIQDEQYLQRYIAENPEMLPLDQLRQDIRPLVLLREFPTPSGPIDAIATDDQANIYLIETKLYKNPDKRLVLAQVLDYGAALWKAYPDPEGFVSRLDILMQQRESTGLAARLQEFYQLDAEEVADFLAQFEAAFASGKFRFVVLMDTISDRLKDLIAYVNASSSFDVLGVALDFYRHEDIDILIPSLHGSEAKKQTGSSSGGRRAWDADSLFGDAKERLTPDQVNALERLHAWALNAADEIAYGTGAKNGSFSPKFESVSRKSVFSAWSNGGLDFNFRWLKDNDSTKAWRVLLGEALLKEGFSLPPDFADRFVSIEANEWMPRVDAVIRILEAAVQSTKEPS